MIHKRWERKLTKSIAGRKTTHLIQGLGKNPMKMTSMKIPAIEVAGTAYENMDFVFADLEYLSTASGFELDGILGFPFLSMGKFSINYRDRRLYLWDDPIEAANGLERLSQLHPPQP